MALSARSPDMVCHPGGSSPGSRLKKMDRGEGSTPFRIAWRRCSDISRTRCGPTPGGREDLDADSLAVVEITLAPNDAFPSRPRRGNPEHLTTGGPSLRPRRRNWSACRGATATVASITDGDPGGEGLPLRRTHGPTWKPFMDSRPRSPVAVHHPRSGHVDRSPNPSRWPSASIA